MHGRKIMVKYKIYISVECPFLRKASRSWFLAKKRVHGKDGVDFFTFICYTEHNTTSKG